MKYIIAIACTFFSISLFAQGKFDVQGDLAPTGAYGIVKARNLKGGYLGSVYDTVARNLIPITYRDSNTLVFTRVDSTMWILKGGLTNEYWSVLSTGGSSLPSQIGNARKFLTTDGTTASWGLPNFGDSVDYTGAGTGMYLRINPGGSGALKYDFANVGGINIITGFSPIIVTGSGTARDIALDTSYATGIKTNLRATNDSAVLASAINAKPNFGDIRTTVADSNIVIRASIALKKDNSDSTASSGYTTRGKSKYLIDSLNALLINQNKWVKNNVSYNYSTPIFSFGDSYTVGYYASSIYKAYLNIIGSTLGVSPNNLGADGRGIFAANYNARVNMATINSKVAMTMLVGLNDMLKTTDNTKVFRKLNYGYQSMFANQFMFFKAG